ncbi:cyclophilin-like fold protein [Streptomyces sp. NBC_01518]|uniref:cyclophilin-like fold protein n=1 Tax=Streptomyces sp. NBC_01518 TaxID=2903891 RepID=UPI0038703AA0
MNAASESAADDHSYYTPESGTPMRIRLTAGETVLSATLDDNATARDFASLLPLTLHTDDLFKREKYGRLPRSLAEGGEPRFSYEVGDIAYWSPGPDIAIFYAHDGQSIPDPGIVILATIDSGVDALKQYDGAVDVTIEAID